MTKPPENYPLIRIARYASLLLVLAGVTIIAGWQFRIPALRASAFGTFVAPNTALCFLCSGISLLLQITENRIGRLIGLILAGVILCFSLAVGAEYLFGQDLGIDQLFMSHRLSDWNLPLPGRFSVNTVVGFSLAGLSLLTLRSRAAFPSAELLALAVLLVSYLSLVAYLLGASVLYDHVMAVHTAALFGVLAVGLLFGAERKLLLGIALSPLAGAIASRRMILSVLGLLPVIGALQVWAIRHSKATLPAGTALAIVASVTVFTILALRTAAVLNETDRKRLESERALLRSSQIATAGRMAASIAHEVNNPLEAVTNVVYLLRTTPLPEDARQRYLELAEKELARVSAIARRTLGFFREETRDLEIDVAEMIDSVVGVYRSRFGEEITVRTSYCLHPRILAKGGEIQQVLMNLIVNAIEALPDHVGTIEVSVTENAGILSIDIKDNGKGIEPGTLERIFEPFFTTKTGHGTGLGLWVSKELVVRNGGTIRVASSTDPTNHGTIFQLTFPAVKAPAAEAATVAERAN